MILLNDKNVKSIFNKTSQKNNKTVNYHPLLYLLKKLEETINLPVITCPHCKSTNCIKWGKYKRTIIYLYMNTMKIQVVNVQRVRCKDCGHTHGILPVGIVPYKQHTLKVILAAISNHESTLNISIDAINKWNKQFNTFLPYLKTMFNNLSKLEIINKINSNINEFYEEFFERHNKILMLTRNLQKSIGYF